MSFNQFLFKHRNGTLYEDAGWRAYDFYASVQARHVRKALKKLGLAYAGELAIPHFMALYDLQDREAAMKLVGGWWLWSQVDQGRHVVGLVKRAGTPETTRELGV